MTASEPVAVVSEHDRSPGQHVLDAVEAYLIAAHEEGPRQAHLLGTGAAALLERRLRDHYGHAYALAVSSATSGLHALALALDLGGKDVVTTPLSYGGTIAGVLHAGGRAVFADVDARTLGLDPASAEGALTPSTRAIVATDLYGVPADDAGLREVADAHGVWYVHDAAQSLGATRRGRPAGSLAHTVVVSLSPGKTLWAGEGGAVLTDDRDLYERLVYLTQHPYRQKREVGLDSANEFGLNARIHPLAAVWAAADFEPALSRLSARQRAATETIRELEARGLIEPTGYDRDELVPSFFRLSTVPADGVSGRRIAAWMGWPEHAVAPMALCPLYRQGAFREWLTGRAPCCRVAESAVRRRIEILETVPALG